MARRRRVLLDTGARRVVGHKTPGSKDPGYSGKHAAREVVARLPVTANGILGCRGRGFAMRRRDTRSP